MAYIDYDGLSINTKDGTYTVLIGADAFSEKEQNILNIKDENDWVEVSGTYEVDDNGYDLTIYGVAGSAQGPSGTIEINDKIKNFVESSISDYYETKWLMSGGPSEEPDFDYDN